MEFVKMYYYVESYEQCKSERKKTDKDPKYEITKNM